MWKEGVGVKRGRKCVRAKKTIFSVINEYFLVLSYNHLFNTSHSLHGYLYYLYFFHLSLTLHQHVTYSSIHLLIVFIPDKHNIKLKKKAMLLDSFFLMYYVIHVATIESQVALASTSLTKFATICPPLTFFFVYSVK